MSQPIAARSGELTASLWFAADVPLADVVGAAGLFVPDAPSPRRRCCALGVRKINDLGLLVGSGAGGSRLVMEAPFQRRGRASRGQHPNHIDGDQAQCHHAGHSDGHPEQRRDPPKL